MATAYMIGHPAAGHINPTLAVIRELIDRGDRIVYYASEPFRDRIEKTGADFRALGDHALFERNLGQGGILGGMAGLAEAAEKILPALIADFVREHPDYLLTEAHAVWGNLLAQVTGVPTATLCSMFAINESLIPASGLIGHLYGSAPSDLALEGLASFGRYYEIARRVTHRYGANLPGILGYLSNPQRLNIVFTSRDFQVGGERFGPSYCFVGPDVAGRSDGMDFPMDQLDGRPLILISMGTMYNNELALYHACFDAFDGAPYQVVMAVGHRLDQSSLRRPPENFIVRQYIPQVPLLERAAAFITHGGMNSAHEAMLAGVPMAVLPLSADHHVVAGRVEEVGAGILLPRAQATAERLKSLAERLTGDPEFAMRSRVMGDTLRVAGGPKHAADEIFQLRRAAVN